MSASDRPPSTPESLGTLLTRLRVQRGLVQKEAARRAEIDGSTLSRLESNERGVSREVLERLCDVLELDQGDRLHVQVAAGFLTEEAAQLLGDKELAALARLLTGSSIEVSDAALLRQYVALALAHARALGYTPSER